ncbi:MAG: hypothetical protein Q7J78_04725 [Clostridiales bacterium]|nr:hypothetical protein [Clostridiales bacterium]
MPLKEDQKEPEKLSFKLSAIYGIEDHIDIIDGRLPAAKNVSTGTGIPLYETLVSEQTLENLK